MSDGHVASPERSATEALERLTGASLDLRAAALLGPKGETLAASPPGVWPDFAGELWAAAEATEPGVRQLHVGTEDGEVFAVRSGAGNCAVAIAERFTLASLMFCDLRAALRDLEAGGDSKKAAA